MGSPPRGNHHNLISHSCRNGRRTRTPNRTLHLFPRVKHDPILIRRHNRPHLPLLLDPNEPENALHLPNPSHPLPSPPRQHFLVSRIPIRLRKSLPHRLPHIHPREILQTPPSNAPPPHNLSQTLSPL